MILQNDLNKKENIGINLKILINFKIVFKRNIDFFFLVLYLHQPIENDIFGGVSPSDTGSLPFVYYLV